MSIVPFIVCKKNNEDDTGVVVSEHVLQISTPTPENPLAAKLKSVIGVLWDDNRSPSPSYHDPGELVWLTVPGITPEDDEDDEDDEDEGEEAEGEIGEESGQAAQPPAN